MTSHSISPILSRAEDLEREIENFVPLSPQSLQFRADLAGLLVVSIAASYESCIKETLMSYAGRHHSQFAIYTQNQYEKLNSKINLNDLYKYAKVFDPLVHKKFGSLIVNRKEKINRRIGKDITKAYSQILSWRHDFAHSNKRNTTIEEAVSTHRLAKHVILVFNEAFS